MSPFTLSFVLTAQVACSLSRVVLALWEPAAASRFQIQLKTPVPLEGPLTSANVYDIDLFGNNAARISRLHREGKRVICYFSAGTHEPNRPDSDQFWVNDLGNRLPNWPRERWLRLSSPDVRRIMVNRIQMAADKGCDGIDPDNMDAYLHDNGLDTSPGDVVDFVRFMSTHAHERGLAIGLKNSLRIMPQLKYDVQFAVNEQCHAYNECYLYRPFMNLGKPVYHIEYPEYGSDVSGAEISRRCANASQTGYGFNLVFKRVELDGWASFCD